MRLKVFAYLLATVYFLLINERSFAREKNESWQSPHSMDELLKAPVSLIPFPQQVSWMNNELDITKGLTIRVDKSSSAETRSALLSLQQMLVQYHIDFTGSGTERPKVQFNIHSSLSVKKEGYQLQVSAKGIVITAKDAAGLFYGVQTLRQLIRRQHNKVTIPCCEISDWPAFGLRGFMHDNGRNFQPIAMLKQQLEILSHYKYNTFHWHLTDNPAWRIESRLYPQLNNPANRNALRDPDSTYRFDEIRDLIRFAKIRNITIIPELDMPGHSAYFEPTFGFKMESEKGMEVLGNLIDEFCREIPAGDCPVIHIGSDEVHIPNKEVFIQRMTAKVIANGRKPMVWNPGLPPVPGTIQQVWYDGQTNKTERDSTQPFVDSYAGYLNSSDALSLIQRYFFQQVCNEPSETATALGGILCCWPDTRVADKEKIPAYNPVWPGAITYSEAVWCGRPGFDVNDMNVMPTPQSEAGKYFAEFEKRLSYHRDHYFEHIVFPFAAFSQAAWLMQGPSAAGTGTSIKNLPAQKVYGNVVRINRWLLPQIANDTASLNLLFTTYVYAREARSFHAWIGFETPARSNRQSAGIPQNGKWDANAGAVYINDQELPGPQWQNPGGNRYLKPTWHTQGNEIPFTDEEFYWTRPVASIALKKGWNKITVQLPRSYKDQQWMFAFVPVKWDNARWVEDRSIEFVASKTK